MEIEEVKPEETVVEEVKVNEPLPPKDETPKRLSKIFTGIAFGLVWFSIVLAIIFDIIALKDVILTFIAAIVVTAAAIVLTLGAFLVSMMLVFGFYLLEEKGFWPLTVSMNVFDEIIHDIHLTVQAAKLFMAFRIVLLVLCVAIIVLAIIGKVYLKKERAQGLVKVKDNTKALSTTALTMAIIGLIVSASSLLIVSAI